MNDAPDTFFSTERSVLGAIILNPEHALPIVKEILKNNPKHFNDHRNATIFEAMLNLPAIDPVTVYNKIKDKFENPGQYITFINGCCPETSNIAFYAHQLLEESRSRYKAKVAVELKSGSLTLDEAIAGEKDYIHADNNTILSGLDLVKLTQDHLEVIAAMQGRPQGIPTGMPVLKDYITGWQQKKYIVVGARTSVGKTAFAINCAVAAAREHYPTLMFSCEMEATAIGERIFQILGQVDIEALRRGWQTEIQLNRAQEAAAQLRKYPKVYIDTDQTLNITKIKSRAKRFVEQYGTSLIIVDYLQRVRPEVKTKDIRTDMVSVSAELQTLATEIDCPVMALAQINRSGINKNTMQELTGTIQESDSPGQDADIIMFLVKPEGAALDRIAQSLGVMEDHFKDQLLEVIISKNRSGKTGVVPCFFDKQFQRFKAINRANGQPEPYQVFQHKLEVAPEPYRDFTEPKTAAQEDFWEQQNPTYDDGDEDECPF